MIDGAMVHSLAVVVGLSVMAYMWWIALRYAN
jgi:hypothetical protein